MKNATTSIILKTAALTLFYIVVGVFFVMTALIVLSPRTMVNVYSDLNLTGAKAYALERTYNKSKKLDDLYNCINATISAKQSNKTIKYIKIMQKSEHFADFANAVNERNIKASEKKYWVYVCDYEGFLRSQYLVALYNLNDKSKAKDLAYGRLSASNNIYSWEFGDYVDCVMTDVALTKDQKISALAAIYFDTAGGASVKTLLLNNIDMVEETSGLSGLEKLKAIYQKTRYYDTYAVLADAAGDTEAAEAARAEIGKCNDDYSLALKQVAA